MEHKTRYFEKCPHNEGQWGPMYIFWDPIDFHIWTKTIFKISSFVFHKRNKVTDLERHLFLFHHQ